MISVKNKSRETANQISIEDVEEAMGMYQE